MPENDLDLIDDMQELYNYFANVPVEFMQARELAYWRTRVMGMHGLLAKIEKVLAGSERDFEMSRSTEMALIAAGLEAEEQE